jgi:fructuronate reductase
MDRLSEATFERVPSTVRVPSYRRQDLGCGIVHLGVGAFHRAHQAVCTEVALERAWGPWGICGVSLRRARCARSPGAAGWPLQRRRA